jgi:hypothetical protein
VQQKALSSFLESDLPKCQLCDCLEEQNDHLMICPNDNQEISRQKTTEYIWRDNNNHGNSEQNNIIELAISESAYDKTWQPLVEEMSPQIRQCIIH